MQEVFGTGDKTNAKRQREDYAVQIRKQKTSDHFKAKRANMMAEDAPATDVTPTQASSGLPSLQTPPTNIPLQDVGIEKALSFIG